MSAGQQPDTPGAPREPLSARRGSGLAAEVREVQNPALGAVLLWRAVVAYEAAAEESRGMPLPVLYLVLPLVLHGPTLRHVLGTQANSGLRKFAAKFSEAKYGETDVLLALHPRAMAMRALSTHALRIAVSSGLLQVVPSEALARSLAKKMPREFEPPVGDLLRGAQRAGHWFRALSLGEIAVTLDVRF